MTYKIAALPQPLIEPIWPLVAPHIARVVKMVDDETTLEHVKAKALAGDVLIVAVSKGSDVIAAFTADIREFDTGMKALYIPMLAGDNLNEWLHQAMNVMHAVAKDFKCDQMRACGRRGWTKVLKDIGWEEQYTVIKFDVEKAE